MKATFGVVKSIDISGMRKYSLMWLWQRLGIPTGAGHKAAVRASNPRVSTSHGKKLDTGQAKGVEKKCRLVLDPNATLKADGYSLLARKG